MRKKLTTLLDGWWQCPECRLWTSQARDTCATFGCGGSRTPAAATSDGGVPPELAATPAATPRARGGRWAPYRSHTEKLAALWLADRHGGPAMVEYEPLSVPLVRQKTKTGRVRWYTPDFAVTLPGGGRRFLEVKHGDHDPHGSYDAWLRIAADAADALARQARDYCGLAVLVRTGGAWAETEV